MKIYLKEHKIADRNYNVQLIECPLQDNDGRVLDASDFAKYASLNYYMHHVKPSDRFFEVEEVKQNSKEFSRNYTGMIFDEFGNFLDGNYCSYLMSGKLIPFIFLNEQKNLIIGLGKELPKDISRKIKDFYILDNAGFMERLERTRFYWRK